ncbi:MAG: helix-turn-helix domain-containing protein [Prevotella sp.]|nr:helix-turn-helix domain-containing protein [Prevotella sp.]
MKELLTEKQYEAAISRIEELYKLTDEHTPVNDPMMVELDHLGQLVEQYEDIHYPIGKPSFQAVIKLRLAEMGLSQKKLAESLHVSSSRINRFIHGKCDLPLQVAKQISRKLDIDADVVLGV